MAPLARWCFHHRRIVVAAWLLALVRTAGIAHATGSSYANNFSFPSTDSSKARNIVQANFATQAGRPCWASTGTKRCHAETDSGFWATPRVPVEAATSPGALSGRWAKMVGRRSGILTVASLALIVAIALPFFSLRLGLADSGEDPSSNR